MLGVKYESLDASAMVDGKHSLDMLGKRGGIAIETFALECLEINGWKGDRTEGSIFFFISYAVRAILKKMKVAYQPRDIPPIDLTRIRNSLNTRESDALDKAIEQLSDEQFKAYHNQMLKDPRIFFLPKPGPQLTVDRLIEGWRCIGEDQIRRFCERQMFGFGGYGWPDITLYREGQFRFVEIKKRGDIFTPAQPMWFRNFARPLGWDVQVLEISVR